MSRRTRLRLGTLPPAIAFALRRVRATPLWTLVLLATFAVAAGLIGWSGLAGAVAQENSVRTRIAELPPQARAIRVVYFTLPEEGDYRAPRIAEFFDAFRAVTKPARRVRIWHSVDPGDPLGTRLVVARTPGDEVAVQRGRLPQGCRRDVCEALALTGGGRIGSRIALPTGAFAVIVGRGSLHPGVAPASELGRDALLVRSASGRLARVVREHGSTVVTTATLRPRRVHGFSLPELSARLQRDVTRLERGDPLVRATAPFRTFADLVHRGAVARHRLLLVAGEAAALVVAFAAFLASVRRRELRLVEDQLATLGAARSDIWLARGTEQLVPSLAGTFLGLFALWVAATAVASERGYSSAFVGYALPWELFLVIAGLGLVGGVLLVMSLVPQSPARLGVGPLELAALSALGLLVWETGSTGALDPDRVAGSGAGPVVVLLPTLAFFAAGVIVLRLLPPAFRLAERRTRNWRFGTRLALLSAARSPTQVAAATTFLAVALGSSLFSFDYRATLERQAADEARFDAGAALRVAGRAANGQHDVAPLSQFRRLTPERPVPVLRLDGDVERADAQGTQEPLQVLALPAASVRSVLGWRQEFSPLSRDEIANRLRPDPVALTGLRLGRDAVRLRVWARAATDFPRRVVLHLLLPGLGFAHVQMGTVGRRWERLSVPLPTSLRGAQLVGVELAPTSVPLSFNYDPEGFVDLGPFEQRRADSGWAPLPSLARWTETTSPDGTSGILNAWRFEGSPVAHGVRFELNGTLQPLIHPRFGLPEVLPGFQSGAVPAIASNPVASEAVDGLLTLDLSGKQIPVDVVGTAHMFPTVVDTPDRFVLLDFDTLFAALNAIQPGIAPPSEAWFFGSTPPMRASLLASTSIRQPHVVSAESLERSLLRDPLAKGTRDVLVVIAVVAAALGLVGLVFAARTAVVSDRLVNAEYEALGVLPSSLRRSAQTRLVALALFGVLAGVGGAVLTIRLIVASVAVTGTAERPLPPILPVIDWPAAAVVLASVVATGVAAAALLTARSMRRTAAARLRA